MRYIPHTEAEIEQMLDVIGLPNIEALFSYVPEKYRLNRPLQIPEAASEQEVLAELTALAQRNVNTSTHDWFLGAGLLVTHEAHVADHAERRIQLRDGRVCEA